MRTFEPWVGSKYCSEGLSGVRILILGESHYGDIGEERSSFTVEVVRTRGQEKRDAFFTKVQKLVAGLAAGDWVSDQQRSEFWEQVAFYNFVQSFCSGPRCRPTAEMWAAAVAPFLETVRELRPQILVVLGRELESHLPEIPAEVKVCGAQHPSWPGFQYEPWQSALQRALQTAASNSTHQGGNRR